MELMKHVLPRLERPALPGATVVGGASLCLLGVRLGGSTSSADISCRSVSSHGGEGSMSPSQGVLTLWSSQAWQYSCLDTASRQTEPCCGPEARWW